MTPVTKNPAAAPPTHAAADHASHGTSTSPPRHRANHTTRPHQNAHPATIPAASTPRSRGRLSARQCRSVSQTIACVITSSTGSASGTRGTAIAAPCSSPSDTTPTAGRKRPAPL